MANTGNTKRKSPPAKAGDDAANASAKRSHRDVSDDEALGGDHPHNGVLVPPREDDFNEKTWWMVDLDPVEETSLQGASVLVKRCMRMHGWDEAKARKVLASYRQFITLKKNHQDWNAEKLSPCYLVDQMWHCHILDVVNYCHDMMLLCGHVVGHNPDGALDSAAKQKRDALRASYCSSILEAMMRKYGTTLQLKVKTKTLISARTTVLSLRGVALMNTIL